MFDMFVILYQPGKKLYVSAIQIKAGKKSPNTNVPVPDWIDQAFLFRGQAPETANQRSDKWNYMTKSQIQDFMGYSLRSLYR